MDDISHQSASLVIFILKIKGIYIYMFICMCTGYIRRCKRFFILCKGAALFFPREVLEVCRNGRSLKKWTAPREPRQDRKEIAVYSFHLLPNVFSISLTAPHYQRCDSSCVPSCCHAHHVISPLSLSSSSSRSEIS